MEAQGPDYEEAIGISDSLDTRALRKRELEADIQAAAVGQKCSATISYMPTIEVCGRPAAKIAYGQVWYPGYRQRPSWRCLRCWYREYLKSSHWERIRERAIRDAGQRCQRCRKQAGRGKNGNPTGLNVHHLTYDRVGEEQDADLIVLCFACHKNEHGIEDSE